MLGLFGKRLAALRKKRKMTQRDVALKAGVDLATVSRLERGMGDTTVSTIVATARALGVRVVDFFSDEPLVEEVTISQLRADLDETTAIAREALRRVCALDQRKNVSRPSRKH